jgi:hypothetical protein
MASIFSMGFNPNNGNNESMLKKVTPSAVKVNENNRNTFSSNKKKQTKFNRIIISEKP